jgi:hypothetical protein
LTEVTPIGYSDLMGDRRLLGVVFIVSILAACGDGSSEQPRDERATRDTECAQVRDHIVDLALGGVQIDREQHRQALLRAYGNEVVSLCANAPQDAVDCALAATEQGTADQCLAPDAVNGGVQ